MIRGFMQNEPVAPDNQLTEQQIATEVNVLKTKVVPPYVAISSHSSVSSMSHESFCRYVAEITASSENPEDPVERMLIEQIVITHHAIGRLNLSASKCNEPEVAASYQRQSTELLGEFRKMCLALKRYREPPNSAGFTVIKQQNNGGAQQIALVDSQQGTSPLLGIKSRKKNSGIELGSKLTLEIPPDDESSKLLAKPEARSSRKVEPIEAKGNQRRRKKGSQ